MSTAESRVSLLVIKIILGVRLLTYATRRRAEMEAREIADRVNDFGRDPIGEGKEEQVSHLRDNIRALLLTNRCSNITKNSRPCLIASATTRTLSQTSGSGSLETGTKMEAKGRSFLSKRLRGSRWSNAYGDVQVACLDSPRRYGS